MTKLAFAKCVLNALGFTFGVFLYDVFKRNDSEDEKGEL